MLDGASFAAFADFVLPANPPELLTTGLRVVADFGLVGVCPPAMKAMATWFKIERGTALGAMVGAL
jgi:hypothetical protein